MNKRALMLTAATVALMSGQAHAATTNCSTASTSQTTATLCDITTVVVTPIATSTASNTGTANDIDFETSSGITVTTAAAALKIDSNNIVNNFGGTISNKGTTGAIGVEINAGNTATPGVTTTAYSDLLGSGTIDLSGTGTGKTGILVDLPTGAASGTLIAMSGTQGITSGTIKVVGDQSYGIHIEDVNPSGVSYTGALTIDGAMTVTASSTTSTTSTGDIGVGLDGKMVGNFAIAAGGSVVVTGDGSIGVLQLAPIQGSFFNGGTLEAVGITTPATTGGNPEGGSALIITSDITGGFKNSGPTSSTDQTTRATIATGGTGPALLISPTAGGALTPASITIGDYTGADETSLGYSFYNRGQISATPANPDTTSVGVQFVGTATTPVTFAGSGMYNSGGISSSSTTNTAGTGSATTALWIGNYASVPGLYNTNSAGSGTGNITAQITGATPGQAIALLIDTNGSLPTLNNQGTIAATAQSSDNTIASLTAYAIYDRSGTLNQINNSGTISATTTTLLDNAQTHVAVSLAANISGVNFQNTGTVIGDVFFGSGNDTFNITGTATAPASVTGNINFSGGNDTFTIGDFATVAGGVLERGGGYANITVGVTTGGTGTLFVDNTNFSGVSQYDNGTLEVGKLTVYSGGTFGLSLSQGFNQALNPTNPDLVSADNLTGGAGFITFDSGATFDLTFGSFISQPGGGPAKFTLFDAPLHHITILNASSILSSVDATIPFLYTGTVCGYNVAGFTACTGTAPSDSQVVLSLTPKSVAQLGLKNYAAQMFPLANAALASDNTLGAAVIEAGSGLTGSASDQAKGSAIYQSIYSQFAPDVTGAARALAVSLTDQATGAVGARQRVLRMYAGQDGQATLWGQEFTQRLNDSTKQAGGYRDSGFGFVLGMDGGSPRNGRYGGAFTFFSGDINELLPTQVKTSSEWYLGTAYSDWRGKGLFFDSQLTAGYGSLTGRRTITIDSPATGTAILQRTAMDKRASLLAAFGASSGYIMNLGSMTFAPQVSLDGLTLREEGYTESGGGPGYNLRVSPYYAKSLRGYLGTTIREDLNFGDFFIQPEARVGYRYDFLADAVHLNARFAGDPSVIPVVAPGSLFSIIGPDPAKGNLVAGAGLATTTGSWSIGANFDYLRGDAGTNSMAGTLTLVGRI